MKIRTSIAAAGAAVVLGGAWGLVLPAVASAHTATHTLKVTSVLSGQAVFSAGRAAGRAENDLNSAGEIIGFDVVYVAVNPETGTESGNVTFDTDGGLLYGTLKITSSPVINGTVTGGTGAFQGATGTILGKSLNKSGTRTAVTITYTT
jgi:hypothetical protein